MNFLLRQRLTDCVSHLRNWTGNCRGFKSLSMTLDGLSISWKFFSNLGAGHNGGYDDEA